MQKQTETFLELLERRLGMLEELMQLLSSARTDLVAMDLEAIRAGIQQQERTCASIRTLDKEIAITQTQAAQQCGMSFATGIGWPASSELDGGMRMKIASALERLADTQAEMRKRNDAHQALLRRSSRAVGAMLNLLQSHAPTYTSGPEIESGTLCEERV